MSEPAPFITITLRALNVVQGELRVILRACPKYKLGAYYVGQLKIMNTWFKVKAIHVLSTAGGRAWMASVDELDEKLRLLELNDFPRPTQINIAPHGQPEQLCDFVVVIHPFSESGSDSE